VPSGIFSVLAIDNSGICGKPPFLQAMAARTVDIRARHGRSTELALKARLNLFEWEAPRIRHSRR
jgi:hypothetical protein